MHEPVYVRSFIYMYTCIFFLGPLNVYIFNEYLHPFCFLYSIISLMSIQSTLTPVADCASSVALEVEMITNCY